MGIAFLLFFFTFLLFSPLYSFISFCPCSVASISRSWVFSEAVGRVCAVSGEVLHKERPCKEEDGGEVYQGRMSV